MNVATLIPHRVLFRTRTSARRDEVRNSRRRGLPSVVRTARQPEPEDWRELLGRAYSAAQDAGEHDIAAVLDQVMGVHRHEPKTLATLATHARTWSAQLRQLTHGRTGDTGPLMHELNAPVDRLSALRTIHWTMDAALHHHWVYRPSLDPIRHAYAIEHMNKTALPVVLARAYLAGVAAQPIALEGLDARETPSEGDLAALLEARLTEQVSDARRLLIACLRSHGVEPRRAKDALKNIEAIHR